MTSSTCGPTSTSTTPRSPTPDPTPAEPPFRILGLDPGSTASGWGVIERRGRRWILAGCGVLRGGPSSRPLPERLRRLHEALIDLIDGWRPREAAVEDLFHARNARSALVLGHARGVLLLALSQRGLSPRSYPPPTVKQAVTGSGAAAKDQVRRWVCRWLGAPIAGIEADASDALAVALCHARALGWERAISAAGRGRARPVPG